jgi:hypothetical protein
LTDVYFMITSLNIQTGKLYGVFSRQLSNFQNHPEGGGGGGSRYFDLSRDVSMPGGMITSALSSTDSMLLTLGIMGAS